MTGLIRLFLVFCFSVVLAYLMTDIKIGDKNIKQHIDAALFEDPNASLKTKWLSLKGRVIKDSKPEPAAPGAEGKPDPNGPVVTDTGEGLSKQDRQKLENFIEKHD